MRFSFLFKKKKSKHIYLKNVDKENKPKIYVFFKTLAPPPPPPELPQRLWTRKTAGTHTPTHPPNRNGCSRLDPPTHPRGAYARAHFFLFCFSFFFFGLP
jgi:hypothetical protein